MEAKVFPLTCAPLVPSPCLLKASVNERISFFKTKALHGVVLRRCTDKEETLLEGMPPEYYDDEWQAQRREKTKELHRRRQEEDEEERRKIEEYRDIGMRLKGYPEEDVRNAKKLVSSFIRAEEEVEERIEEAAERGELTELVLMVIWNRLDLARRDEEKDAIRSLDLLYRRVEDWVESFLGFILSIKDKIGKRKSHIHGWLKECKKHMVDTFPREDPFTILAPAGFDIDKHQGPLPPPPEVDDVLLRVDFVREVDALLKEVRLEQNEAQTAEGLDPESVARRLKQQEKQKTIRQVEALLDLAINLKW
ncbi:hypothetical protein AB3S75_021994 [Citrus x aurantiifolia]